MEGEIIGDPRARTWKKSWIAYVGPSLKYGLVLMVISFVDWLPLWIAAIVAARLIYKLAVIRAVKISLDEEGVWLSSGVLPWTKGVYGVKWRDIDQASYTLGLIPWLTKSHTVRVGHRFTKGSEVIVADLANAKELVHAINGEHAEMARQGALA